MMIQKNVKNKMARITNDEEERILLKILKKNRGH